MTKAPYLLPGPGPATAWATQTVVDSMMYDGLFCAFDRCAMGAGTEKYAKSAGSIDPRPPGRAAPPPPTSGPPAAMKEGRFDDEIVPVEVPQRKGDPILVDDDEGVRPGTTAESLGKLRPAFDKDGNITAGNASQISDGGAAVIVISKAKAEELGVTPLGEIVGYGQVAGPDAVAAHPAVAGHQPGARQGRHGRRRRRPVRAQRGLRRRRRSPRWTTSASATTSSTSTAAPSPSATRSACPAPAWPSRCSSSSSAGAAALGAAALCGGGGQGDAILLRSIA